MRGRPWLSVVMLAAGVGLLLAGLANAADSSRRGGIFVAGSFGSNPPIDPQVSWVSTAWWLEYAPAAKLYTYPDKPAPAGAELVPEVASRFAVSQDGRTYTFWIRKGFRFSDGAPVTAKSFSFAIRRVLNRKLGSPAAQFIADPHGVYIVGYSARRDRLTIRLRRADSRLLSILAMPFFQATSTTLPLDREVTRPYPSAGPYAFTRDDETLTSIRRNRYWKRGPGRQRPRRLDGVDVLWRLDEHPPFPVPLDVRPVAADEVDALSTRLRVNRNRFWAEPVACVGYLGFNNRLGIFAGNPQLRKAVSWVVDRTAFAEQGGLYRGSPWTQLLSPVTPGAVLAPKKQPYSVRPDVAKARRLAAGHFRDGHVTIGYFGSGAIREGAGSPDSRRPDPARLRAGERRGAELRHRHLRALLRPRLRPGQMGHHDLHGLVLGLSRPGDLPQPRRRPSVIAIRHVPVDARRREVPEGIRGRERARRQRTPAGAGQPRPGNHARRRPVVAMRTYNNLFLFSNRVDPRSLVYQPALTDWSIPALALK